MSARAFCAYFMSARAFCSLLLSSALAFFGAPTTAIFLLTAAVAVTVICNLLCRHNGVCTGVGVFLVV